MARFYLRIAEDYANALQGRVAVPGEYELAREVAARRELKHRFAHALLTADWFARRAARLDTKVAIYRAQAGQQ